MEDFDNIQFNAEKSERVDRFLRKEMSKTEAKAFIADVKTDSELKDYYQRQFNLMRGVKFKQMTEIMQAKEKELSRINSVPEKTGRAIFYRYKWALSTCAVAAALICGVFVWDGSVTKSVGSEMYQQVMRGGDIIDELVEAGKYDEAIVEIDEQLGMTYDLGDDPQAIAAYNQQMNNLKYRKALVYLQKGKKREAKSILKQLGDPRAKETLDKLLW